MVSREMHNKAAKLRQDIENYAPEGETSKWDLADVDNLLTELFVFLEDIYTEASEEE
uniref:Uncharacterized protein n=1 Tax=viral metagenome TaxID=1070528 RepID=A0A6M3LE09_9ZZZZ